MIFKTGKVRNYIRWTIIAIVIVLGLFVYQNPLVFLLIVFLLSDRLRGVTVYQIKDDVITIMKTKEDVKIEIEDVLYIVKYKNDLMGSIPLPSQYALKTDQHTYTVKHNLYNNDGDHIVQVLVDQYNLEIKEESI